MAHPLVQWEPAAWATGVIAQLVERWIVSPEVGGSSPPGPASRWCFGSTPDDALSKSGAEGVVLDDVPDVVSVPVCAAGGKGQTLSCLSGVGVDLKR